MPSGALPFETLDARSSGRYTVNAVASALAIFGDAIESGSTSLEEAASSAGVARSTAYRLLVTLTDLSLLERLPGGGYSPGPKAFAWATRLLEQLDVRTIARPALQRLREESRESANLALLRGTELLYVDAIESPGMLRTVEEPGSRAPIHAAAVGKTVAAHLDEDAVRQLVGPEPYRKYTPNTVTTETELMAELGIVRDRGYAYDVEAVEVGVACVAAPIFLGKRVMGAISLSGPRTRMDDDRLEELGEFVRSVAAEISDSLSSTDRPN